MEKKPSRALIVAAFIAIYFVWGTTYLAIGFGITDLTPFVLSSLRYTVAGILLMGWSVARKYPRPASAVIKINSISGIIMLVGGSGLVVVAEKYIHSGHAAVVIATEPLWFLLLDKKRWPVYFSNAFIIAGLLLGFGGIAMFSYFAPAIHDPSRNGKIYGTIITLAGSILWVIGTLYNDRHKDNLNKTPTATSHIVHTGIQLLAAGVFSAFIAAVLGEWTAFRPLEVSWQAWSSLAFLIVMGSVVAYLAFTWLVTVQPPALVSTHTYINPIVAVILGWLIAGEYVGRMQIFALAIVLIGVVMTRVHGTKLKDGPTKP